MMICVGVAPGNGDTACWATTMYFMKLKIWSIFLQSHNPQRVCSFPLCKWVCRSYFWESMKAGQTFQECTFAVSSIGLAAEARLVANWGKHDIVNEQYNRFWKYDKGSHAVVGTKRVLIFSRLLPCWSWYQRVLPLENFTHKQQIMGNMLRPQNILKPTFPFSPIVSALFHELTLKTFALKLETQ